jgi:hypothetical protein
MTPTLMSIDFVACANATVTSPRVCSWCRRNDNSQVGYCVNGGEQAIAVMFVVFHDSVVKQVEIVMLDSRCWFRTSLNVR